MKRQRYCKVAKKVFCDTRPVILLTTKAKLSEQPYKYEKLQGFCDSLGLDDSYDFINKNGVVFEKQGCFLFPMTSTKRDNWNFFPDPSGNGTVLDSRTVNALLVVSSKGYMLLTTRSRFSVGQSVQVYADGTIGSHKLRFSENLDLTESF